MPQLEEGNFWIRATLRNSVSLEQSSRYVGRMREILRRHPEVETVVSQLGRPDDGTDVSGFSNIELFAPLKPFDTWPRGLTKEKLTERLEAELSNAFPGVIFSFSQMISDNVEEAVSGVKGENSVKVVGADLRSNERLAEEVSGALASVRGIKDVGLISSLGQPSVTIVADRAKIARYGLNTGDVEAMVQAAIGGQVVTQVFEGEKRFDVVVRWLEPYRRNVEAISRITVSAPDGSQIPLGQLAAISLEDGPSVIYREDGRRYAPVKFSVRGRDLASAIAQGSAAVSRKVTFPYGTHLDWAGEINELNEAEGRLLITIPITPALITLLVYAAVKDWLYTGVVLVNIPVACAGGLVALLLSGIHFSVSAAMGFVSIFGVAIQDAILMVNYTQRQWQAGHGAEEGARLAAEQRFRPVLMTTLVAMLGLLPAALSHGIGAQTQKPLAVVVIGGAFVLAGLTRVLQPPLLVLARRFNDRRAAKRALCSTSQVSQQEAASGGWVRPSWRAFGLAAAALAADEIRTLSAAQAVDLALAHNPVLQAQRQGIASARAGEVTAALRPNPVFTNGTLDFTASLQWPFESGGKRQRRIDSARLATGIAGTDYEDARRTLVLAVRQAYTQILLARSNLALAQANLKDFSEVERLNQVRFDKGAISGVDLDRVQLQRLQFDTDVQDASLALQTARANVKALVATPELAPDFEAADELELTDFDRPLPELLDLGLRRRPDLQSAERAREKARADLRLAEANAVTDVAVTVGWIHTGASLLGSPRLQPFFPLGETTNAIGTGVSIPLRIFDRNQGEIARTRSEVARVDELARAVRNQVINDVEVAYRTLVGSRSRVGLYERTYLAKSREAREIAELSFKKGATSILDLLEAERTDRSVQLAYRQALASYLLARSVLDTAVGEDLAP